jgi:hypothetical protein
LVRLDWPEVEGAKAAVVADLRSGPKLWAADLDGAGFRIDLEVGPDDGARIQALTYRADLAALRLPSGEQAKDPEAGRRVAELGTFQSLWSLEVGEGHATWTDLTQADLAGPFADFKIALDLPECTRFGASAWRETIDEASSLEASYVVPVAGDRVLIGIGLYGSLEDGNASRFDVHPYLADRRGLTPVPSPLRGIDVTAAYRDPGGDLYLGGDDGSVWRVPGADLDATMVQIRPPTFSTIAVIDGGRLDDGGLELVISGDDDYVSFHRNGAWSTPIMIPTPVENVFAWGGEGLAFARSSKPATIIRIERTGFVEERADDRSQMMSVRHLPGFGVVGGSDRGHLWTRSVVGEWSPFPEEGDPGWWTVAITGYDEGLVFLLASGAMVEYKSGRGSCESMTVLGFLNTGLLATIGGDVIAVANNAGHVELTYLPRDP